MSATDETTSKRQRHSSGTLTIEKKTSKRFNLVFVCIGKLLRAYFVGGVSKLQLKWIDKLIEAFDTHYFEEAQLQFYLVHLFSGKYDLETCLMHDGRKWLDQLREWMGDDVLEDVFFSFNAKVPQFYRIEGSEVFNSAKLTNVSVRMVFQPKVLSISKHTTRQ